MELVIIFDPLYHETSLLSDPLLPEASVCAKNFNVQMSMNKYIKDLPFSLGEFFNFSIFQLNWLLTFIRNIVLKPPEIPEQAEERHPCRLKKGREPSRTPSQLLT